MNRELVFVAEPDVGRITVEISQAPAAVVGEMAEDLGTPVNVNCGRPSSNPRHSFPILQPARQFSNCDTDRFSLWLYRLYHNSTVDGPGRRSVIAVAGCSIRCEGCYSQDTHERSNGRLVSISEIVAEIITERDSHDGVTILGGEPFDQPEAVAELVFRLKNRGFHITVYSGYKFEKLIEFGAPSIQYILSHIDLLIDGPFVKEQNAGAGEYRGSRNQRIINIQTDRLT
ncbi:MAG: radical SAM protein [Acidobacteria bacterium]|nr:radical SAM protein [Acidobacteriota bacterium]